MNKEQTIVKINELAAELEREVKTDDLNANQAKAVLQGLQKAKADADNQAAAEKTADVTGAAAAIAAANDAADDGAAEFPDTAGIEVTGSDWKIGPRKALCCGAAGILKPGASVTANMFPGGEQSMIQHIGQGTIIKA